MVSCITLKQSYVYIYLKINENMDCPRPCGCKGRRTCLICEKDYQIEANSFEINKENGTYVFCPSCNKAWPGWDLNDYKKHPQHEGTPLEYPGVYIDLNFLTIEEENRLVGNLDEIPWDLSQSGRRKQNFGPKCNFKKRKLKLGAFNGFPKCTQFVQNKFTGVPVLQDFQTIEQCSLEYDPLRGASIDPHIDDCWIWGERIVTVNLLSDSVLTMTYNNKPDRYNLNEVATYPAVFKGSSFNKNGHVFKTKPFNTNASYPVVRIPMPRRSLLVIYGSPRYEWEHQILRDDVVSRRVCLAYREFTPPYLPGGQKYDEAKDIFIKAKHFWDVS